MLQLLPFTTYEMALYGWILGALFTLLFPFYLKVRAGDLTWSDFNYGYLVNFLITIFVGVTIALGIFEMWIIPEGSQFIIFIVSFLTSAGFDDSVIKEILKIIGLYESVWKRLGKG